MARYRSWCELSSVWPRGEAASAAQASAARQKVDELMRNAYMTAGRPNE